MSTSQRVSRGFEALMTKWSVFAIVMVVLISVFVAYWYVYGRERDLFESTELGALDKELNQYLNASTPADNESKRLSDLFSRRSALLSAVLDGRLGLTPNGTGSTLEGNILSNKQNWITNRVYVHVRILEQRHCGEKLRNRFSDIEWEKHCAADPHRTVMDVVDGQSYECFVGAVGYGETARCYANTLLPFEPSKQAWDNSFSKVIGHPEDPLGLFR
jgi:hypothetical protein